VLYRGLPDPAAGAEVRRRSAAPVAVHALGRLASGASCAMYNVSCHPSKPFYVSAHRCTLQCVSASQCARRSDLLRHTQSPQPLELDACVRLIAHLPKHPHAH